MDTRRLVFRQSTALECIITSSHGAPAGRTGNKQVPNFDEEKSFQRGGVIMSLSVQVVALRTRELRELLEDEDKINHTIRCAEKFQGLQRAAENLLLSNKEIAKIGLSQKPKFRDAKLLLAMKYKQLENIRSIIQAKQELIAEKYSVHDAQWSLLKKINHAEQESEMLFQRFAEGKATLAEFLDSFLSLRKLQHIRMTLVKKLKETIELRSTQRLGETHPDTFSAEEIQNACLPVCGLTTAVILPACCHPPFLLPLGAHANTVHRLQHLPFCYDYKKAIRPGAHGRGPKWPVKPVHLQPLKFQQRKRHQEPQ
ncbi:vacuolar protein sorting-associated protein 37D-like [Anoplopoma fimbria]|uniref:vacuolar protein sorting-associated protein 37D-like n=1 Tax=Anoplopoma fimbria TaxID=229290 RepID=UPI0023ECDA21|nr:vacuolar protein sorting-associated protein 37D-like [Anoplopoma fimbria]